MRNFAALEKTGDPTEYDKPVGEARKQFADRVARSPVGSESELLKKRRAFSTIISPRIRVDEEEYFDFYTEAC